MSGADRRAVGCLGGALALSFGAVTLTVLILAAIRLLQPLAGPGADPGLRDLMPLPVAAALALATFALLDVAVRVADRRRVAGRTRRRGRRTDAEARLRTGPGVGEAAVLPLLLLAPVLVVATSSWEPYGGPGKDPRLILPAVLGVVLTVQPLVAALVGRVVLALVGAAGCLPCAALAVRGHLVAGGVVGAVTAALLWTATYRDLRRGT